MAKPLPLSAAMPFRPVLLPPQVPGALWLDAMPGRFGAWSAFQAQARRHQLAEVVCLTPLAELAELSPAYHTAVSAGELPFRWRHLPMRNFGVPEDAPAFRQQVLQIAGTLRSGEAIEYSEPQVHVASADGGIVGFVGFDRSRDPKSKPTTGELWALYVLPAHWDKGAGLALWDAAREGLIEEGCTEVTLWIPLLNERALRFAELAGFKRELNTARTAVIGGVKLEEIRLKRKLD